MTTANRNVVPRHLPVAAGRTPQQEAPAWCAVLERAEALLLTEECLAASALAVLGTATPRGRTDRSQFERARLTLSALPDLAADLARQLDAPGGAKYLDTAAVLKARSAIAGFKGELEAGIATLQAIDTHGQLEGAGAMALYADVTLGVALEQLERADVLVGEALAAMAGGRHRGQA